MSTILVVEDERGVAETLQLILEDEGYRVLRVANGREALAQLELELPDLVISDLMMPVMNGQMLYQAMQGDDRYRAIPFLLISALDSAQIRRQLPGVPFLVKPFLIERVLITVASLLAGR